MNRRTFIAALSGAAAWPFRASAQQSKRGRLVGILMPGSESDSEQQAIVAAFRDGLRQLGWSEGNDVRLDFRWQSFIAERANLPMAARNWSRYGCWALAMSYRPECRP